MKKTISCYAACIMAMLLTMFFFFTGCGGSGSSPTPSGDVTILKITNTSSEAITIGFVSAAKGGACPDLDELLTAEELADSGWCTDYEAGVDGAGKCLKTLGASGSDTASVEVPNPDGKCISGSFGTGGFASCQTSEYPDGWTQGEFTLNPKATTQEAIDISAVNGVNYELSIAVGSGWNYEDGSPIVGGIIGPNKSIDENVGIKGVYPNACTDCIRLVGDAPCPAITPDPLTCNSSRICNVYRNDAAGGTVEFKIGELL